MVCLFTAGLHRVGHWFSNFPSEMLVFNLNSTKLKIQTLFAAKMIGSLEGLQDSLPMDQFSENIVRLN